MKFKWPFVRSSIHHSVVEQLRLAVEYGRLTRQNENHLFQEIEKLRAQLQKAGTAHQQSIELFNRHLTRLAQGGNN